MDPELKKFCENLDIRREQRILAAKMRYSFEMRRLKNYLRVLKETRDFDGATNSMEKKFIEEIKKIRPYIDEQIINTDFMIRLLGKLSDYDFKNKTMDETFRKKVGIPIDKVNRLISNGCVLNEEEKNRIILFINS